MNELDIGDRVRIDIPDEIDPDYTQFYGEIDGKYSLGTNRYTNSPNENVCYSLVADIRLVSRTLAKINH